MHERTAKGLEWDAIRQALARHTSFSAGKTLALRLEPATDLQTVRRLLEETREARLLLDTHNVHLGGVHDVRPVVDQAERGRVLLPQELLAVRSTLQRARLLRQTILRAANQFPNLADWAAQMEPCPHVADEIGRCLDDQGNVQDDASPQLARIRAQLRAQRERLTHTLERLLRDPDIAPYLQEPLITQRGGRYVIPVKAEFKNKVPGLIHDQSASGATFFIEPLSVVELGNLVRELELEEEREVRRVLMELSTLVAEEAPYIHRTVEVLAYLDLAFAKAHYANALDAVIPEVLPFQPPHRVSPRLGNEDPRRLPMHPGSVLDLRRARHPLIPPDQVVPVDVYIDDDWFILLITGPNTGGKTVTLKTVGLLVSMAQAGLAIPAAEGSRFTVFDGIYADIGDEQSIEQSLSTFSSHMTNIIDILRRATRHSLVLLDELGAGTDPEEGAALARAILMTLLERSITTLATSHYSELKVFAHNTPGVMNASVEFDPETLRPTYELTIGLPGRSNALAIARRLGLEEEILERAARMVRPESLEADALLAEIREARERARRLEQELTARLEEVTRRDAELRERLTQLEQERRRILEEARASAEAELEALRREIRRVRSRLRRAYPTSRPPEAEDVLREAEAVLEAQAETWTQTPEPLQEAETAILQPGDKVYVPNLQAEGEVVAVHNGEVEVQVGTFRLRLPRERVEYRGREQARPGPALANRPVKDTVRPEIDVRGMTVDEALRALDKYLDDAYLAGLPWVRVIHGKGTGTLRRAVREMLRQHPLVNAYRPGAAEEGGDGVTVVTFVGE